MIPTVSAPWSTLFLVVSVLPRGGLTTIFQDVSIRQNGLLWRCTTGTASRWPTSQFDPSSAQWGYCWILGPECRHGAMHPLPGNQALHQWLCDQDSRLRRWYVVSFYFKLVCVSITDCLAVCLVVAWVILSACPTAMPSPGPPMLVLSGSVANLINSNFRHFHWPFNS